MEQQDQEYLLEVKDLKTYFYTGEGVVPAVDGVSFRLRPGEVVGIVGESGCGKSVASLSILRLIPSPPGKIVGGQILFQGVDLLSLNEDSMQRIRGNDIAMIFQEPMTSLNPVFTIGEQIGEALRLHQQLNRKMIRKKTIEMLGLVGISRAEGIMGEYPDSLSGGMRQRVMIAMALCCNPRLLIADEPTTALDVTIQAQILELMKDLRKKINTSIIFITHDLGVVAEMADHVVVMYAGKVVEDAGVHALFQKPLHPYTRGLFNSKPKIKEDKETLDYIPGAVPNLIDNLQGCYFHDRCQYAMQICSEQTPELHEAFPGHLVSCWLYGEKERAGMISEEMTTGLIITGTMAAGATVGLKYPHSEEALVRLEEVKTHFPIRTGLFSRTTGYVRAVDGISLSIFPGETYGLVGESGSGKSTVGRTILRLQEPTWGKVFFQGVDVAGLSNDKMRRLRREMQLIFQDPYGSLNPRMTVGETIGETLEVHGVGRRKERRERVEYMLEVCGLAPYHYRRYPHEFSGGQRQRVVIARALALQPVFIVADEPVSSLDVSIQSQIINLLEQLQYKFGLTYLFISHDLSVVKHIADRVGVMYLGILVEEATKKNFYQNPQHPYTRALLSAVPVMDPFVCNERVILKGDIPNPANPPAGCRFHTRCPQMMEICREMEPKLQEMSPGHRVACHLKSGNL